MAEDLAAALLPRLQEPIDELQRTVLDYVRAAAMPEDQTAIELIELYT